jgi:hypothetical protein
MTQPNADRPPLTPISVPGLYRLRLTKPKIEKVKMHEDGTVSARLFFVDAAGQCLSKNYGTKYHTKALAMLVGRITGTFAQELRQGATVAEFLDYLDPACNKLTDIGVEVTPDGEWQGRPQYKYKLTFGKGTQKPVANTPPPPSSIDF